ncbi:hypothetical protein SXIM_01260 [Streptomyces xiamenensis]|uniref:Uncharacterized protein n=1 Tax=Streptomyces xiamenensis TaxID=408015 RepID=A0A0F7FP41_9ACTN|nr:hypothetical protein [Streptomyces xiamenensis]AKG41510.1 hypothetical protein SXIM_01260 [Streptomyces xiamenensis]
MNSVGALRAWERSQLTAHYWHIMRSGAASAPDATRLEAVVVRGEVRFGPCRP